MVVCRSCLVVRTLRVIRDVDDTTTKVLIGRRHRQQRSSETGNNLLLGKAAQIAQDSSTEVRFHIDAFILLSDAKDLSKPVQKADSKPNHAAE